MIRSYFKTGTLNWLSLSVHEFTIWNAYSLTSQWIKCYIQCMIDIHHKNKLLDEQKLTNRSYLIYFNWSDPRNKMNSLIVNDQVVHGKLKQLSSKSISIFTIHIRYVLEYNFRTRWCASSAFSELNAVALSNNQFYRNEESFLQSTQVGLLLSFS